MADNRPFEFDGVENFRSISLSETAHLFCRIKFKFLRAYTYLKPHIFFNSNGLAIGSGFPDITHMKKIMVDNWSFWPAWPSFCPNLAQFQTHPNYWWDRYMVNILERDIEKCWVNRVNEKICRSEFAAGRPFWIWTSSNLSWYIPTWNCTFCSIVMV